MRIAILILFLLPLIFGGGIIDESEPVGVTGGPIEPEPGDNCPLACPKKCCEHMGNYDCPTPTGECPTF